MYAIIEDSGRQFKVAEGERIDVDLRAAKAVEAEVKAKKLISYKYTRREQYHRKVGHRQRYLRVRITEIAAG
jgi:ribosomal protein L21